jgi:hypothetical protein
VEERAGGAADVSRAGPERQEEAGVGDGREDAEEDTEAWIASVGAFPDHAGDQDDPDQDDRDGRCDPPRRPL